MKITKLSLAAVAAMALTTAATAEVTADFSGNVKLWYETADDGTGNGNGLFHQNAQGFTGGDAAISLEAKGKAGVLGYGLKYTAVDTLGLENNIVSARRAPGNDAAGLDTAHWAEKAFITYQMGNTTAKVGRQHLNTPLAFTEAWNVSANSFDAVVLVNTDIPNTKLVGAYVGKGNGGNGMASVTTGGFSTVQQGGKFSQFGTNTYSVEGTSVALTGDGAYAAVAHIKPMEGLGLNGYYYNVQDIADAAWIDADYAVSGVKLGALYATMLPKGQTAALADTDAYAVKASTKAGSVSLLGAYSSVSSDSAKLSLPVANVATGFKKTKLPTAGVYSDGVYVAQAGSDSFKLKAAMPVGNFKLAAQYISVSNDKVAGLEVDEFDIIASTKIKDVNLKAIYINRDHKLSTKADWDHVRIIAGINF